MKNRTIIISDLHLGGGEKDPGDDHVYQNGALARFIAAVTDSADGRNGEVELFINGDFLEFAQANQDAYRSPSRDYWCSESESVEKLNFILSGHSATFSALGALMRLGNAVTIAAGNHDVDLWWDSVQQILRYATYDTLKFETGVEWVERYEGRLQISHGHMKDPANTFKHWANPVKTGPHGTRLEMCAGTLFMVNFVNGLEAEYPFADNLLPVQNLATLLWRGDRAGFRTAAWALLKIAMSHPVAMAESDSDDYGRAMHHRVHDDDAFALRLFRAALYRNAETAVDVDGLRQQVRSQASLAKFILDHWRLLDEAGLNTELAGSSRPTLGPSASTKSLGKIVAGGAFGKEALRRIATDRVATAPTTQVVVMGHTHVSDDVQLMHSVRYLNPGSWTRYIDLEKHPEITLNDLKDESKFPYSLKYVQVTGGVQSGLHASLETFDDMRMCRFA